MRQAWPCVILVVSVEGKNVNKESDESRQLAEALNELDRSLLVDLAVLVASAKLRQPTRERSSVSAYAPVRAGAKRRQ